MKILILLSGWLETICLIVNTFCHPTIKNGLENSFTKIDIWTKNGIWSDNRLIKVWKEKVETKSEFSFLFNVYSESFYGDKYLTTNIVNVYLCVCQRPFFLSLLISSEDLQMTWQLAKYWKGEEELSPPNVKKVHQFK